MYQFNLGIIQHVIGGGEGHGIAGGLGFYEWQSVYHGR
jgi:hypothetical protein